MKATKLFLECVLLAACVVAGCGDPESFGGAARGELNVSEVVFAPTPVRTEGRVSVTVQNSGRVAITDIGVELWDEDESISDIFFVETTTVPSPFNVGDSFVLPLLFRPMEVAEYTGTLRLFFNDPSAATPSASVPVQGAGIPRAACVMTVVSGGDFGQVLVGDDAQGVVEVRNDGARACTVSGVRVSQEASVWEVLQHPTQLAAGEVASFTLRFAPQATGDIEAQLRFVASEVEPTSGARLDTDIGLPLTGEGYVEQVCVLEPFPDAVIFPRAVANAPLTATLGQFVARNVGNIDCTIDSVTLTQGIDHFLIETSPAGGTVISPETIEAFSVRFSPIVAGPITGEITITTVEGFTLAIPLNALADPEAVCSVSFTPNPVIFPAVGVGLTQTRMVTLTNTSVVDCDIADVTINSAASQDFAISTTPLPVGTLAPGASTNVQVAFTPTTGAPANAALEVEYGGTDPFLAPMLGFGAYANLRIFPMDWTFGYVTEGCVSESLPVQVFNVSTVAARIDGVSFTNYSDPNFQVLGAPAPGTILAGGQQLQFQARVIGSDAYGGNRGELLVRATGASQQFLASHLFGESESLANSARTQVFLQDAIPSVDILFVIDDSGSMGDKQQNLANNIQNFIQFFASGTRNVDFHIGVTSTDVTSSGLRGALVGPFIDKNHPDPVSAFVQQANLGINGDATEQGLKAAELALTAPANVGPGGLNEDFLRENSVLSIVVVSDENDFSPGLVTDYVNKFLAVKGGNASAVLFSAIAGDVPSGCSGNGFASQADRYYNATLALGGVFESICASDWAASLQNIGDITFEALTKFTLDREPDLNTVTVLVTLPNGTVQEVPRYNPTANPPVYSGWSVDAENNVVFFGEYVPVAGSKIEISYNVVCIQP